MECPHTLWLDLQPSAGEVNLVNYGGLRRLHYQFLHAASQTPSIITFFSGSCMNSFSLLRNRRSQKRTWMDISAYAPSLSEQCPLLFAMFDPRLRKLSNRRSLSSPCHEESGSILSWYSPQETTGQQPPKNMHSRGFEVIVHPFTDVICCYAGDYGGLGGVANVFGTMLVSTNASYVRPRLVIIVAEPAGKSKRYQQMQNQAVKTITNTLLFSSVRIVDIGECTNEKTFHKLLSSEAEIARKSRRVSNVLFSYAHLQELLEHACDFFTRNGDGSFDIIKATRIRNPPQDLSPHVSALLSFCSSQTDIECTAPILVALSIILDGFPRDAYFQPSEIVRTFYENGCIAAYSGARLGSAILPQTWMAMVRFQVEQLLRERAASSDSTMTFHQRIFHRYRTFCAKLANNGTCFLCLARSPEIKLPCGHSSCDNCFALFGRTIPKDHYTYGLDRCPLCQEEFPEAVLKVKPPTAGVRILTIDGGGIRGIIPLQLLQALQDQIGLPLPIQENFDMAFGTSSGALIILGLCFNGWSVEECEKNFIALSKEIFTPRLGSLSNSLSQKRLGFLGSFFQKRLGFLISLLADSQYNEKWIEKAVQEAFGESTGMMDATYAQRIGCKVGVTATTTKTSSPCIFTNYGSNKNASSCLGYKLVAPESRPIMAWDA